MTTILFYVLIVLALAGSSYYGWRSAKSAKNRQETKEQKRLRSALLCVNVLLFAGFLSPDRSRRTLTTRFADASWFRSLC